MLLNTMPHPALTTLAALLLLSAPAKAAEKPQDAPGMVLCDRECRRTGEAAPSPYAGYVIRDREGRRAEELTPNTHGGNVIRVKAGRRVGEVGR